jgi:hypothetical protein
MWDNYRRNSKGWQKDPPAIIHPRIWFGSANIPFNPNITHIINCAEDDFTSGFFRIYFPDNCVCLDARDNLNENITKYYPLFEQTMNRFLSDPECRIVYVHCECGINRSGFLVLIYMCRKFGLTIEEAVKAITIQRPCALTNPSFKKQVVEYIKKHD